MDNDEMKDCVGVLLDLGCCALCALRLSGFNDVAVLTKPSKELTEFILKASGRDAVTQDICICCLGILQKLTSDDLIDKIQERVNSSGHEFESFLCAITLPISILHREHGIWISLKDRCQSFEKKSNIMLVKDVWKAVCVPRLATKLLKPYEQESKFEINLLFTHEKNDDELKFLLDLYPEIFRKRKRNWFGWELFTRMNVTKALESTSDDTFKKNCPFPPEAPVNICECQDISYSHSSFYMAGRYNKYSRKLSQTPWLIDGIKKMESSVQERICDILTKYILPQDLKFSSSGREDVDVRMLGNGRPFVVEFINPKRVTFTKENIQDMQKEINSSCSDVKVCDLQVISKCDTSNLKDGEMEKRKSYSALCWIKNPITQEILNSKLSEICDLKVDQKTPIRVLHRRPLALREKVIHTMSAALVDDNHFKLRLKTQAGTYIKEFVHGDFCRTIPNLGILLNSECDILALDVEEVELDWPKSVDSVG